MLKTDQKLISSALNFWANWIETNDMAISANDAIKMGRPERIQILDLEQQEFIVRLRKLSMQKFNIEKATTDA